MKSTRRNGRNSLPPGRDAFLITVPFFFFPSFFVFFLLLTFYVVYAIKGTYDVTKYKYFNRYNT